MMPFEERARIFQSFMALQRAEHTANTRSHHPFGIEPVSFVTVRRDHLLEVCSMLLYACLGLVSMACAAYGT